MRKITTKLSTAMLMTVMAIVLLSGCSSKTEGNSVGTSKEVVTLKLGHAHPTESQFHAGSVKFAELVAEKTDGKVKVDVFHSSQMGDEAELSEGTKMGTVDISLVATGAVTKYYPRISVLDLPYLFRDYDHVDKVLQGEVGNQLANEAENVSGIKFLGYWESGFRHFLNSKKPLKSPQDLEGLKIRTPEWPVLIETTKTLGANPVPMPFSELYLAAQHGVVDGQEGPVFAFKNAKMYEVQKYMVLDGHTYTVMLLMMNPDKFNNLSPDIQTALLEAASEAGEYERSLIRDNEVEELEYLETEGGLTIEKNPDKEEWRDSVKSVYDQFSKEFGEELVQQIIETK